MIYVVGIGPGHIDYILPKAKETLKDCDLIIGYSRAISSVEFAQTKKIIIKALSQVLMVIEENKEKNIAIVASGDPGFYGITEYIKKNVHQEDIRIIPGISSFQYMMSRLGKSWHGSFLGSVHGREDDLINLVKENKRCIFLTDAKNSPNALAKQLFQAGLNYMVYVGENLSYPDEKISSGRAEEIMNMQFSSLSVFVVEEI